MGLKYGGGGGKAVRAGADGGKYAARFQSKGLRHLHVHVTFLHNPCRHCTQPQYVHVFTLRKKANKKKAHRPLRMHENAARAPFVRSIKSEAEIGKATLTPEAPQTYVAERSSPSLCYFDTKSPHGTHRLGGHRCKSKRPQNSE